MMLNELGAQYIETAARLRARAKALDAAQNPVPAKEVCARISELRAVATRLKKYGRYLQSYYEKEGENHAI